MLGTLDMKEKDRLRTQLILSIRAGYALRLVSGSGDLDGLAAMTFHYTSYKVKRPSACAEWMEPARVWDARDEYTEWIHFFKTTQEADVRVSRLWPDVTLQKMSGPQSTWVLHLVSPVDHITAVQGIYRARNGSSTRVYGPELHEDEVILLDLREQSNLLAKRATGAIYTPIIVSKEHPQ